MADGIEIEVLESEGGPIFTHTPKPDPVPKDAFEVPAKDQEAENIEQFNLHIKSLVALFVDQEVAELKQRITDLELLVGQPTGTMDFVKTEVPWYTPPEI
jgi:hypothetical protein